MIINHHNGKKIINFNKMTFGMIKYSPPSVEYMSEHLIMTVISNT